MRNPGTLSAIQRLFARHRLGEVHSLRPLPGGQLNTAFHVERDFVLRFRDAARATGSLQREAVVLRRLQDRLPVAEVFAHGVDDLLGEYLIQRRLPGRNLLEAWLENPDVTTREWWIRQWAAALQQLHEERLPAPGDLPRGELRPASSWRAYLEGRIRKRLDLLLRVPTVDRSLILAAERYLRRRAPVLEDGPACLIHRDQHFSNVLVEGPRLVALLDFELAESGPPDYELDTIFRFLRYPWLFAPPEQAAQLGPQRLASVWIRLRRAYPAPFAVPRLRERLALYALDHDLSCLIQATGGRWGGEQAVHVTLRRLAEILDDRYGPE